MVRANFVVFFAIMAAALIGTYLWFGLLTAEVIALAVFVAPAHILAMFAGARLFHCASEKAYRRVAYAIITLAALVSMPLWDSGGYADIFAPTRPTPRSSHRRSARRPDR